MDPIHSLLFLSTIFCISGVVLLLWIGRWPLSPGQCLMVVMGSGGHTSEMVSLVSSLLDRDDGIKTQLKTIVPVITFGDKLSEDRLKLVVSDQAILSQTIHVSRSRQVGQSYLSSVFTTIRSLFDALAVSIFHRPNLLLVNGPGVCLPLVLATRLLSPASVIVFVESFCRTRSLSLTGKIIYHSGLAHHFVVQWPKLKAKYERSHYFGILV